MSVKIPRAIRLLTHYGAAALKSTTIKGRYFGPMIPKRIAANVRKRALREGTYGTFTPHIGGWDASWDEPRKFFLIKPLKGHLRERTREQRATKIENALKQVPDKIKKYYQEMKERRPKKDITYIIEKLRKRMDPSRNPKDQ